MERSRESAVWANGSTVLLSRGSAASPWRWAWKNGRTNLALSIVIRSFMGMASGCCPMVSSSKGTSYTARSRPQWRLEARSVAISIGDQQFSNVARALVSGKKAAHAHLLCEGRAVGPSLIPPARLYLLSVGRGGALTNTSRRYGPRRGRAIPAAFALTKASLCQRLACSFPAPAFKYYTLLLC